MFEAFYIGIVKGIPKETAGGILRIITEEVLKQLCEEFSLEEFSKKLLKDSATKSSKALRMV